MDCLALRVPLLRNAPGLKGVEHLVDKTEPNLRTLFEFEKPTVFSKWRDKLRPNSTIFGDCNLHGTWDPTKYDPSAARNLQDYLETTGRIVLNDGLPTLFTTSGSALDIKECPGPLAMK